MTNTRIAENKPQTLNASFDVLLYLESRTDCAINEPINNINIHMYRVRLPNQQTEHVK